MDPFDLIPDGPFTFLKWFIKIHKWIADNIPWWVIVLIGLSVAIFAPLFASLFV